MLERSVLTTYNPSGIPEYHSQYSSSGARSDSVLGAPHISVHITPTIRTLNDITDDLSIKFKSCYGTLFAVGPHLLPGRPTSCNKHSFDPLLVGQSVILTRFCRCAIIWSVYDKVSLSFVEIVPVNFRK